MGTLALVFVWSRVPVWVRWWALSPRAGAILGKSSGPLWVARALRSQWSRRVVVERFLVFIWLLQSVAEVVAEYDGVRIAAQQVSNVQGGPCDLAMGFGLGHFVS